MAVPRSGLRLVRDGYVGGSVNAAGIVDGGGDRLLSPSHQRETIGPSVGTGVHGREQVLRREYSLRVRTAEYDVAVNHRVPLSVDRRGHGNRKGRTSGRSRRSCEVQNRGRRGASHRHQHCDSCHRRVSSQSASRTAYKGEVRWRGKSHRVQFIVRNVGEVSLDVHQFRTLVHRH